MKRKQGFTIIELLTVMGVIAVLIGLMVPALALVKDYSKRIQQKAQFHGIDMGLEMYKTEFGSYPRSDDNSITPHPDDPTPYCGSNKLAEALVGLDLIGFHPNADFRSDGQNLVPDPIGGGSQLVNVYDTQGTVATWQTGQENIDARKGPFVDLEKVNAFRLDEIYANLPAPFTDNFATLDAQSNSVNLYPLALCDVYAQKRSGTGAKKTGTPILYFRARSNYSQQNINDTQGLVDDIYNLEDNINLLGLGMPNDGTGHTVMDTTTDSEYENFENMIVNENLQTIRRPYRADSYILISAGKDGDFGTADDVFNFDKEVTE